MHSRCPTTFSKISYYDSRYDSLRIRSFGPSNLMVMAHKARPATSAILSTWLSEYGTLTCERVAIMARTNMSQFYFCIFSFCVYFCLCIIRGLLFIAATDGFVFVDFTLVFFHKAITSSLFFHNDKHNKLPLQNDIHPFNI